MHYALGGLQDERLTGGVDTNALRVSKASDVGSCSVFLRGRFNPIPMKGRFLYEHHRFVISFAAAVKDKRHQTDADDHGENDAQGHRNVT